MSEEAERRWLWFVETGKGRWREGLPFEDSVEFVARWHRWLEWKQRQWQRLEETNELTYET